MKLGIAVVYLFGETSAPLLDLHLGQIEKHTQVPYTIYGSINRLAPQYRERLQGYPKVQTHELPATELRDMQEHSLYLDQLMRIAIEDGATHLVTLHLDSFPVRSGWAEELAGRLNDFSPERRRDANHAACVFASIDRIQTACLFFTREWFLRYQPPLMLSAAQRADPRYAQYVREHDPIEHSGIGYGFTAYLNGQTWYYLRDTSGAAPGARGRVYDGMIFHLHAGVRMGEQAPRRTGLLSRPFYVRLAYAVARLGRRRLPVRLKWWMRDHLGWFLHPVLDRPRLDAHAAEVEELKRQLYQDPEGYLNKLRPGP